MERTSKQFNHLSSQRRRIMLRVSRFVIPMFVAIVMVMTACGSATPTATAVMPQAPAATAVATQPPATAAVVQPTSAPAAATIRIGGVGPLSAPGDVVTGIAMQFAMNLAVKDINAKGGVLGKPVELIFGDTEGLPERGTAVTERLITNDKVIAIVGEAHSAVGLAEADVAHKYNIPILFSETWSDKITQTGYPEVFRIAPASSMTSMIGVDWHKALGSKSILEIAENTDYGTGQAAADKKSFEAAGIKFLDTIFVDMTTTDFQPILARIQAMNPAPDAINVAVTSAAAYNLEQQMVDMGIAPTAKTIGMASSNAIAPEFWQSVPNGNYYVFNYIGLPPALFNDTTKHVADEYRNVFKTEPASYALEAYDSVWIVANAITKAGSTDSKALISAIEDTDVVLAQGRYWFKYTSKNPVPSDGSVPAYMWHQWPDPAILLMQYFKPKQAWQDAAIVWPPTYQTYKDKALIPYGTTP
jgi:branched-chain amino acid transport system substrate-binding protein